RLSDFCHSGDTALANLVENEPFTANVTVVGSYSYATQIGGNTTVPLLCHRVRRWVTGGGGGRPIIVLAQFSIGQGNGSRQERRQADAGCGSEDRPDAARDPRVRAPRQDHGYTKGYSEGRRIGLHRCDAPQVTRRVTALVRVI
ncbi:MAG TPA: hypothetical protein VGJ63_00875, partial [Micromonosporaceae bacterium]